MWVAPHGVAPSLPHLEPPATSVSSLQVWAPSEGHRLASPVQSQAESGYPSLVLTRPLLRAAAVTPRTKNGRETGKPGLGLCVELGGSGRFASLP